MLQDRSRVTDIFLRVVGSVQCLTLELGWQPLFHSCRPNSLTQHRTGVTDPFLRVVGSVQCLTLELGWQTVYHHCRQKSMTQHRTRVTDLFLIKVVGSVQCLTLELGWQSPIVKCPILHVLTLDIFLRRVWGLWSYSTLEGFWETQRQKGHIYSPLKRRKKWHQNCKIC